MKKIAYILLLSCLCACGPKIPQQARQCDTLPSIYPDYIGVSVPSNIAPLNCKILDHGDNFITHIHRQGEKGLICDGRVGDFDLKKWHSMLTDAQGDSLLVDVYVRRDGDWLQFRSFPIYVDVPIDKYISYRLIEPSYVSFEEMRLCQRDLENWDETDIFANSYYSEDDKGQCINCHSYQDYNRSGNMQFHVRVNHGGTLIVRNGDQPCLYNLKTPQTLGAGVYPSWHPTLPLIAYSVNTTGQMFHSRNRNKVEVQDGQSDLILYDVDNNQVSVIANDSTRLECFPYWNHDGTALYYVSAVLPDSINQSNLQDYMQMHYADYHYDIFRKAFDPATRSFGETDTIFLASEMGKSAIHPRESRDGRYLVFTMADYGVFHIWHHDADLYVMDLQSRDVRPLAGANSADTESYHSFSSGGQWLLFSSRRDDGNYTRLYICRFNPDGTVSKPFLLPQRNPDHNIWRYKSYNVPEFMDVPVVVSRSQLLDAIAEPPRQASFKE